MKNKYWIVYLHINKLNNKVYVGITHYVDNPNTRWHSGNGYRKNSLIYKAIAKYGWSNFSHIILCKTTKERACLLESALIQLYKNKNRSYNIALGGEGASSFSPETIEKLKGRAPWIRGKHHTQEAIEKIRQAGRRPCLEETKKKISTANSGSSNGMYGKKLSKETVQAIIKRFSKPVIQLDFDDNIIREFLSASEAERHLNVSGGHIGCCCLGKRKTAYGYKWKYKDG